MKRILSKLKSSKDTKYCLMDKSYENIEKYNIQIFLKYQKIITLIEKLYIRHKTNLVILVPCIVYHISMDLPDDIKEIYHKDEYYKAINNIIIENGKLTYDVQILVNIILSRPYIGSGNIMQIYNHLINLAG
jgi:hypothetical protein